MRITIRVDSSLQIGTGHIARCLALAEELRKKGAKVEFFCLNLPGNVAHLASNQGFPVHFLDSDPGEECARILQAAIPRFDALIVDHYQLDASWERLVRPHVDKLLVLDDLANRPHDCDLLVDPNFGEKIELRYAELVSSDCKQLLGPSYALLRKEFSEVRVRAEALRSPPSEIKHLLIFYGGIDLTDETTKTLDALDKLGRQDLSVDVVIGERNPQRDLIEKRLAGRAGYRCLIQVENMAELMLSAQLAIGAGGTNSWERCCLGLPSLVVSVADNQVLVCLELDRSGYHFYLGHHSEVSVEILAQAISDRLERAEETRTRGLKAMDLVDGLGCEKVAAELI